MAYNKVILVGRLANNPELRHTQNSTAVTSFRLAVDRQTQDKQTDFLDIVAWKSSAEFAARNFTKGQEILVEGKIQIRPWTDKDGNKRHAVEVIADRFSFVGSRQQPQQSGELYTEEIIDDEDLPF